MQHVLIFHLSLHFFQVIDIPGSLLFDAIMGEVIALGGLSNLLVSDYSVIGSIDFNYGKFPGSLGNLAIVDSKYLIKGFGKHLKQNLNFALLLSAFGATAQFDKFINSFQLEEYAISIVGMYRNRFTCYIKSEKDLNREMITFTNSIMNSLTVQYPASLTLPLVATLQATKFVSLFLDQIFLFVVVMLAILGVILMFSLLLANVDERTYEFGMLRALGLKQTSLVQVIMSQTLLFAIPGILVVFFFLTSILQLFFFFTTICCFYNYQQQLPPTTTNYQQLLPTITHFYQKVSLLAWP